MHSVPGTFFQAAIFAASIVAVAPVAVAAGHPAAGSPAAGSAPAAVKTAAAERAALIALDAHFSDEVAAKGFAAFDDFFADDAVYLPTFEPRVEGKKAIMESFRPLFDDHTIKLTWIPLRAEVAASGELGWTTGSYELTRLDEQGVPHVRRGKYVTIWRRQADGSWRAVLDGGNPDSPPAPAPAAQAATPPAASKP
jgi:ketosteroid isomerase-like protein